MSMGTALVGAHRISGEDVDRYRSEGHLLVQGLAASYEVAHFAPAIAAATARHTEKAVPLAERDTYGKAFVQVMNLWRDDETVARFVLAERFASVAAQLLGVERVRVYHDQALFKEPGGGYTPWHQDAMYWPLDGHQCITMWMPLVDIVPSMGGLTFATGSHAEGALSDVTISDASEAHFDALIAERKPATMRAVMTVIYFADGLAEPTNPSQENDLRTWLPGLRPGDLAVTSANPVVG